MPKFQGRPFPEPSEEEIAERIEEFTNEIRQLLNGDLTPLTSQIEAMPEVLAEFEGAPDKIKELLRWETILTNACFILALMKKESPFEIAGKMAASLMRSERMWMELVTALHAENN